MNNFYKQHRTGIYGLAFLLVLITVFAMPFIISNIKTKSFLKKEMFKQLQLANCQDKANEDYNISWGLQCTDGTTECTLPKYKADVVNQTWKENLDRCVALYQTNQ